jgi:TonB family protein
MARKRWFTPQRIASVIAAFSLIAMPLSLATGWAAGYEQGGMRSRSSGSAMGRATTMQTPSSPVLIERSPSTIDEYAAYVRDRLQVAAMELKQEGNAELKLTIGRDGSIQETEVVGGSSTPARRDQVMQLVNSIKPLPPLPANIDALTVTADLTFDYPGENLYDHYGRLPRSPG